MAVYNRVLLACKHVVIIVNVRRLSRPCYQEVLRWLLLGSFLPDMACQA